jgi:hypothetical protein
MTMRRRSRREEGRVAMARADGQVRPQHPFDCGNQWTWKHLPKHSNSYHWNMARDARTYAELAHDRRMHF